MAINQNPYLTFGQDITPEQMAVLRALIPQDFVPGMEAGSWRLGDKFGPTIGYQPSYEYINGDMQPTGDGFWSVSQPRNISNFGQSDVGGIWDGDGNWSNYNVDASNGRMVARVIASALGTAAAGGAFSGAGAAGTGAAGAGGETFALGDLGNFSVADMAMSPEMVAGASGIGAAGTAAGSGLASTATQTAAKEAATQALQSGTQNSIMDAITSPQGLSTLAGAAVGAATSGDQEKTTSIEPWKEAQPVLKDLLTQGQTLNQRYQAQPFSPQQQAALGNLSQLYGLINQNAGGLLMGPQANASGANQFVRGQPRGLLGTQAQGGTWNPEAYGSFGSR